MKSYKALLSVAILGICTVFGSADIRPLFASPFESGIKNSENNKKIDSQKSVMKLVSSNANANPMTIFPKHKMQLTMGEIFPKHKMQRTMGECEVAKEVLVWARTLVNADERFKEITSTGQELYTDSFGKKQEYEQMQVQIEELTNKANDLQNEIKNIDKKVAQYVKLRDEALHEKKDMESNLNSLQNSCTKQ